MDILDIFYEDLTQGISIADLLLRYPVVVEFVHGAGLTSDMRLARGRVKRLCDEVAPARRFAQATLQGSDLIQFPLDSGPIDCSVLPTTGKLRKIQITVAQARARLNVMRELDEKGIGRGYLGVTDDRPTAEFMAAMSRERIMYSPGAAQKTLVDAIRLSLEKKGDPRGANTLLIQVPLDILPKNRVDDILPELVQIATTSPFDEIFVVGNGEYRDSCIKLK
ncbi:MAG TPA: hypothetical protein VHU18_04450 [Rhizomicrobium sp.]|nr:hypothetical protein [Rhizomicrobium sp.]